MCIKKCNLRIIFIGFILIHSCTTISITILKYICNLWQNTYVIYSKVKGYLNFIKTLNSYTYDSKRINTINFNKHIFLWNTLISMQTNTIFNFICFKISVKENNLLI